LPADPWHAAYRLNPPPEYCIANGGGHPLLCGTYVVPKAVSFMLHSKIPVFHVDKQTNQTKVAVYVCVWGGVRRWLVEWKQDYALILRLHLYVVILLVVTFVALSSHL